jgi:hypothetical protein
MCRLIEQARRYVRLRRRYWWSFFGGIAVMAVPLCAFSVFRDLVPQAFIDFALPFIGAAFMALCVVNLVTWFQLIAFRCPACRQRFVLSVFSAWPSDRCRHCGLDLRAASMQTLDA